MKRTDQIDSHLVKLSIYITTTVIQSLTFTSIKQKAIITLTSFLTHRAFLWLCQACTGRGTGVSTEFIVTVFETCECWKKTVKF